MADREYRRLNEPRMHRKVQEYAASTLKGLRGVLGGELSGIGLDDESLRDVDAHIRAIDMTVAAADLLVRDADKALRRIDAVKRMPPRAAREDERAYLKFRWSGWTTIPPRHHRRKRAALQVEVDELYRAEPK